MFVAFEGLDAVGKSTLIDYTAAALRQDNFSCSVIKFPHAASPLNSAITDALCGAFGKPAKSNPFANAALFALDRVLTKHLWLKDFNSDFVLADRFVLSNLAYNAAKLPPADQVPFADWLFDLEFVKFDLPRPDLTVLVVAEESIRRQRLLARHNSDALESDFAFATDVLAVYDNVLDGKVERWKVGKFLRLSSDNLLSSSLALSSHNIQERRNERYKESGESNEGGGVVGDGNGGYVGTESVGEI